MPSVLRLLCAAQAAAWMKLEPPRMLGHYCAEKAAAFAAGT